MLVLADGDLIRFCEKGLKFGSACLFNFDSFKLIIC